MFEIIRAFFRPQFAAWVAAGAGVYSAFNSGGGVGGGGGGGASQYNPTGQLGADNQWQQFMRQMGGETQRNTQMIDPQLLAAYQKMQGINTQPLVGAGAQAGAQYGDLAALSQMYSGVLGNQAGQEISAGRDLYNLGRDPQQQLHDYMQNQTVDNSRAGTSARGIGMSAGAAGIENDATRLFNMNWQNQQLARANTGLQGMNAANQMAGADLSGSMNFGQQAPQFTMQAAQAPFAAQSQAYGAPIDWANQFTQAQQGNVIGPQQGMQGSILPYLGYGGQAGAWANQGALGQSFFGNMRGQQNLSNLVGGLYAMQGQQGQNNPNSWWGGGYTPTGNNPNAYNNMAAWGGTGGSTGMGAGSMGGGGTV